MERDRDYIERDRQHCRELLEEALRYAHTPANLASELGVSHQAVGTWLKGTAAMTRANYLKLTAWLRKARRRFKSAVHQKSCLVVVREPSPDGEPLVLGQLAQGREAKK